MGAENIAVQLLAAGPDIGECWILELLLQWHAADPESTAPHHRGIRIVVQVIDIAGLQSEGLVERPATMTALNALGDAVAFSLKEWLGESAGPSAKRHASAEATGSASTSVGSNGQLPGKGQSSNPSTHEQNTWLRGALQDLLGAFGRHVSARVDAVEQRADVLEDSVKRLSENLEERRNDAESMKALVGTEREQRERSEAALGERLDQLRAEINECNTPPPVHPLRLLGGGARVV